MQYVRRLINDPVYAAGFLTIEVWALNVLVWTGVL